MTKEEMKILRENIKHSAAKIKYAVLTLLFIGMALFLHRNVKVQSESGSILYASVTTVLKRECEELHTMLWDRTQAIRGQWQTDMEDDYYYNLLGGTWEVKEYVDSAVESTGGEWEEDEYKEYVKRSEKYLGMRFVLNKEDITKRAPGGFVFDTYEDLFASVRQPYTLEITPPFVGAMVSSDQWEETMNANYLFIDSNGKAYLKLRGYFFVIERAGDS